MKFFSSYEVIYGNVKVIRQLDEHGKVGAAQTVFVVGKCFSADGKIHGNFQLTVSLCLAYFPQTDHFHFISPHFYQYRLDKSVTFCYI